MWVQPATSAHIALSSFKFSFSRFCVIGQKTGHRGDRTAEGQGTCLSQPPGISRASRPFGDVLYWSEGSSHPAPHTDHIRCGLLLRWCRATAQGESQGRSHQQPRRIWEPLSHLLLLGSGSRGAWEDHCDHVPVWGAHTVGRPGSRREGQCGFWAWFRVVISLY